MVKWIKNKLGISDLENKVLSLQNQVKTIKRDLEYSSVEIVTLKKDFELNNRISTDVSMKDKSYMVLSGKWRGKDYVEIYPIYPNEMDTFVREFKDRFRDREFKIDATFGFKGGLKW